jgi:hypothetical protein
MNPNPVPEAETKRFADLLADTLARADHLPKDEFGQALRGVLALSVLHGDILGKILASQAGNVNVLSQMLATLSGRLDQIQITLEKLLAWAREVHRKADDDQSSSDWWKN